MRAYALAAVHVAAAFWLGCSDILSPKRAEAPGPDAIAMTSPFPPPIRRSAHPPEDLSVDALLALDNTINELMSLLSLESDNVDAMRRLAWLYAAHGWDERAVGPLARALEFQADNKQIQADLDRVIERLGWEESELEFLLPEAASAFAEAVDMWGHGC